MPVPQTIPFSQVPFQAGSEGRALGQLLGRDRDLADFGVTPGTVNVAKFAEALTTCSGGSLIVPPGEYVFPSQVTTEASVYLYCRGKAIFRLANGAIVNTDVDSDNYAAILQVRGAGWFVSDGIVWDGNRDNQTYPATVNTFGRGSRPFRHNGVLEFVPGNDNATRCGPILITRGGFINAYMNGLAFWQCSSAAVRDCDFRNNTWNGAAGCDFTEGFEFTGNRGFRNGVSTAYDVTRQTGDRATVQVREYVATFTAASEGIPTIPSTNSRFSTGINISGNRMEEDQVEAIFVRGAFGATIEKNVTRNIGYGRTAGAGSYNGEVFFPAHIWCEWGTYTVCKNDCQQSTNNTAQGWMQPDGIVIFSFEGDGADSITVDGTYASEVTGNKVYCGEDFDAGSTYSATARKKLNFRYGIRSNGNALIGGNTIEGVAFFPIHAQNDNNFNANALRNLAVVGNDISNFTGDGGIVIAKYGTTTGDAKNLQITGNKIRDGRSATTGLVRALILFDVTMDTVVVDGVIIMGNDLDGANSNDSALNYMGVRTRWAAASKGIVMEANVLRDVLRAFRVASGASISIGRNVITGTSRFLDLPLAGAIGTLSVNDNIVNGITFAGVDFEFGAHAITDFIFTGNTLRGTGVLVMRNYPAASGNTQILNALVQPNVIRMGARQDLRRTFAGAPTTNSHHVGEIVRRTDTGASYIAVDQGNGAADWAAL